MNTKEAVEYVATTMVICAVAGFTYRITVGILAMVSRGTKKHDQSKEA